MRRQWRDRSSGRVRTLVTQLARSRLFRESGRMRADIHDGPEQTLQSEAGYSNARPHQSRSTKTSCTARPDHTVGSIGAFKRCPLNVRVSLHSGHDADVAGRPSCANFRHSETRTPAHWPGLSIHLWAEIRLGLQDSAATRVMTSLRRSRAFRARTDWCSVPVAQSMPKSRRRAECT